MANLDTFFPSVVTQDTRKRLQVYTELVNHLKDPGSSMYCEEMDNFIDGLGAWLNSSNYKISLNGLEIVTLMVNRMGENFRPYVHTVLPSTVDRLGDNKDQVREQAQELLLKLMVPASNPQYIFERLQHAFTHKLWRVREEILLCLQSTLNHYGGKSLGLSKLVPVIVKLLEDQSGPVREAAVGALVEIYRHVGERVRADLARKDISRQKMNTLMARFDEARSSGNMVAIADAPRSHHDEDDIDFAKPKVPVKRASSAASTTRRTMLSSRPPTSSAAAQGGVDEDFFMKEFGNVKKINLFSARELTDHINKTKDILSDPNNAWEKRAEALKTLRALMIAGAADYDEFFQSLRSLEAPVQTSVKDLRSQIVREACITIAYMSQQLGNKFDHFAEMVLSSLIALIPNSAKVMAFSGLVCIRFVIQNTYGPRLIPIITSHCTSKASVIRKHTFEFIEQLLLLWPTHTLERHIAILQEAIKKGISDADSDARVSSRKAFWGFADHFKDQADCLLNSLDVSKQKLLQGELSNSSSNNSLNSAGPSRLSSSKEKRSRSASTDRSRDTYSLTMGARRSLAPAKVPSPVTDKPDGSSGLVRSNSDLNLANKPLSAGMVAASRLPAGGTNSLPRKSAVRSSSTASHIISPERSRPRSRIGVSQSQPSSRSGSPSSRLSYVTYNATPQSTTRPRRKSGIPRSQGASRETSPSRIGYRSRIPRSQGASRETSPSRLGYGRERKLSGQRTLGQAQRTQKTTLGVGQDAEKLLSDALQRPLRKRYESYDSDDAASETSSVCSERSFSSYGRTSETEEPIHKDVNEIVSNLGSSSWAERKEGLLQLQNLLRGTRALNRVELKKVTEIFTRMFHDPHSKVFSVFLEVLLDLISVHRNELIDWLYILLTRLLNKLGGEMLGSVQAKHQRVLEAVRDSFPFNHQFSILTKFIIDQTQTPNLKVKVGLLNYMHGLILMMDASDFSNSSDTRLAVSRIITWTTEPKSVDVRKTAQAVLISLFNLNTSEFSQLLSSLPKTFQDGATKILHNHLKNSSGSETDVLSPRNVTSPPASNSHRYRTSSRGMIQDEYNTENMNPEEIYNSIRKTSADIQNLSKLDSHYDEVKKERDTTSQDSGIQSSMHDVRVDSPETKGLDYSDSPRSDLHRRQYNPSAYQEDNYNRAALAEAVFDVENELFNEAKLELPVDQGDVVAEILTELSNHNERQEERKNAMLQLIKMTREGVVGIWEEHFKTILLLLLETLGDSDGHIRALALRVLREILRHQPTRFKDYAELTILKILEAHKDSVKEVTRAAEECAVTLANSIPTEQCVRVLNPIIQTAEFPVNQAAIKMQTKVIENMSKESLTSVLPDVMPGLLKGYDNQESSVRKASVFALVALNAIIGEDLKPYLLELNGSKMKLLNLYIKRAMSQSQSHSKATSPTTSDGMV